MNVITCAFCLASDRNLFFVEERRLHSIYAFFEDIVAGQYVRWLQSEGLLRLCWQCQARVNSFDTFSRSAQRSLRLLKTYFETAPDLGPPPCQSSLVVTDVERVDIAPAPAPPKPEPMPPGAALTDHAAEPDFPLGQLSKDEIKVEGETFEEVFSDAVDAADDDHRTSAEDDETLETPVKEEKRAEEVKSLKVSKVKKEASKKKLAKKKHSKEERKPVKSIKSARSAARSEARWTVRWVPAETAAAWYAAERPAERPCPHCRTTFHSEDALSRHLQELHDQAIGEYECNICSYRFASLSTLRRHIALHFTEYTCRECAFQARSLKAMEAHCRETHKSRARRRTKPSSYLCKRCKDHFPSFLQLREHRLECSTYKCAKCEKTFKNKCTYFDHLPLHKEGAKEKLYCHICDKQFTSASWFKTHFRTSLKHVSRDTFQHECPHCHMKFHIAQRLKEHVAAKHLNRGLYACDLCPKSFTVNKSLKKHCARVHNIGTVQEAPRDKVCEHCGKAFTSTTFLNDHMRMHTGEKPFQCTLCPAAFAQNGTLYIHTLGVHKKKLRKDGLTDSPTYQCEECGKEFSSNSQMRTHHKLTHLRQSNFSCEACNKVFSSSTHLKNHLAGRHGVLSGDTFKCDTCGKRYNTNTALKTHMKRHGGLESSLHKCRACAAQFKHLTALHLHFKVVHLKLRKGDKVSLKNIGNPDKELIVNGEPQTLALLEDLSVSLQSLRRP